MISNNRRGKDSFSRSHIDPCSSVTDAYKSLSLTLPYLGLDLLSERQAEGLLLLVFHLLGQLLVLLYPTVHEGVGLQPENKQPSASSLHLVGQKTVSRYLNRHEYGVEAVAYI